MPGCFEAMGFAEAARHKSKEVTLYRQGGINIVINTEKEGLAHSSYIVHGTNAYAIGLKVEDAAATVARARALGAEPFEQRPGPGELTIPAIRGVGGGVIYFIDAKSDLARVWDIEFEPVSSGADGTADAGLIRVDHIAQTMNYEEMLTWLLFYISIFDTRKAPMVDLADPGGLVRSQAIESGDGALRLTLNGAENQKTLAGHFIAERFGSTIQHLAFATGRYFRDRDGAEGKGVRAAVDLAELLRRSRNPLRASHPTSSIVCVRITFSTTATRAANISSSTAAPTAKVSSSRSSSAAATTRATARPMHRSASPP